jgi:hypothetical protein
MYTVLHFDIQYNVLYIFVHIIAQFFQTGYASYAKQF